MSSIWFWIIYKVILLSSWNISVIGMLPVEGFGPGSQIHGQLWFLVLQGTFQSLFVKLPSGMTLCPNLDVKYKKGKKKKENVNTVRRLKRRRGPLWQSSHFALQSGKLNCIPDIPTLLIWSGVSRFDMLPPALPIFIRFSRFIIKFWKQGKKLLIL